MKEHQNAVIAQRGMQQIAEASVAVTSALIVVKRAWRRTKEASNANRHFSA